MDTGSRQGGVGDIPSRPVNRRAERTVLMVAVLQSHCRRKALI